MSLTLATLPDGCKAFIMRTSDRITFKKCRRQWGFSSHLKMNLGAKQLAAPLWFGSAIHYALEDFHGYNVFGHPTKAFKAYCLATAKNWRRDLPPDAQEHFVLGEAMMNYYTDYWLASYPRKVDKTFWHNGEPQVEVNFEIQIPEDMLTDTVKRHMEALGVDVVLYRGTMDRVVEDEWGHLWVDEYKTAKVFQNQHYLTDPQITTYVWAATLIYDRPVVGVIYEQFIKKLPNPPRIMANGQLSAAQNQVTSYPMYKEAMERLYGSVEKSPSKNQAFMNQIMRAENEDRDRYIIRERIPRNAFQMQTEAQKILLELEDMINPNLALYPAPTRDCSRMCSFLTPCVNMDDGSDWEAILNDAYASRDQDMERFWRRRLPDPKELQLMQDTGEEPDLATIQFEAMEDAKSAYKLAQIDAGDYEPSEFEVRADPFEGADERGGFNMAEVVPS